MNLLGKAGCELAERGFDALSKVLNQIGLCRMMGALTVLLPGRLLLIARGFLEHVFTHVIRVAGIGVLGAAFGQVGSHRPQAGAVGLGTSMDIKLDGQPIGSRDELHLEAIKPTAFAGATTMIRLTCE